MPRSQYVAMSDELVRLLFEDAGLIQAHIDGGYIWQHMTLEEYLAACYLTEQKEIALMYQCWQQDHDRWYHVILLVMGCLLRQNDVGSAGYWLSLLVSNHCGTAIKTTRQQQQDAFCAAVCYSELGGRRVFASHPYDVITFEQDLRNQLVDLLERPDSSMTLTRRLEAATALARLHDPRYPVSLSAWATESASRLPPSEPTPPSQHLLLPGTDQPQRYWCLVPGGSYVLGGWGCR
ncbi:MAG: hypothetical protein HC837_13660 [Chloroflexaceae bacterium]|nr:hypothetical protein [Chloroflexaceae bacterium]